MQVLELLALAHRFLDPDQKVAARDFEIRLAGMRDLLMEDRGVDAKDKLLHRWGSIALGLSAALCYL